MRLGLAGLHRSRAGRWTLALGSAAGGLALAALARSALRNGVLAALERPPRSTRGGGTAASLRPGTQGTGGHGCSRRTSDRRRARSEAHATRFRLGRWLSPRTTSLSQASQAWALVSACWIVRAAALFLLLGAPVVGYSVPLALLFLCAGTAAAALPIGPAGTATQIGAHTAALLASGIGASQALSVSVSVGTLGVLTGTAILLFAVVWRTGLVARAHAGRIARGFA
jgi:hypothetical protein